MSDPGPDLDDAADVFSGVRGRLFGVAYRMLGSWTEAEDVVQDAWVRWQLCDRDAVKDPTAFLITTTTRLCLNALQSARARRETYIGPWLPEPADTSADPALGAERGEALEYATLLLLEKLSPAERAAYVLREAFDYSYRDIGATIDFSEVSARQLVSRARKRIGSERRESVGPAAHRQLLEAFLTAAQSGDFVALEELFAADVVSYTDGNGMRGASRIPVHGATTVAKYVAAFTPRFWPGTSITWLEANGRTGAVVFRGEAIVAFVAITATAEGITQLLWVLTPQKLARVGTWIRSARR